MFVIFHQLTNLGKLHSYRGPAPAGSRDTLRMNGVGIRKEREREKERKEVDIPWFTQKANKAPARDLLWSRRPQAPSGWGEGAAHLLERVLEAWAGKWTQRASVLQGINLKKRKREKMTQGDQASVSKACHLFSEGAFTPWVVHWTKWKMQSQLNIPSVLTFINTRFLPAYHFINKGLIFCTLSSGPEACWHFMTPFW